MRHRPTSAHAGAVLAGAALAAASLLQAPAAPALPEPTEPPVALRTSPFATPDEMAGTGLTPEVKVRARIDARGRVAGVEVLAIDPPSEYDDLLRRVVVANVERWRYAPARADGEPVEATLEWTVQFKARRDADQQSEGGWMRLGLGRFYDLPGTRVFTLPREKQEEYLRRYGGIAEKHLDRTHRRQVASPHFVVVSDAEEPRTAEIVAGDLEATFFLLDRIFRPKIEPQPMPYKVTAYAFARRSSFSALGAEVHTPEWVNGLYSAPGFLAFHLEEQTPGSALSVLLHEATHAFTERHLVRPGLDPPRWLMEGLAEYVGNSDVRKGELIPGRTPKTRVVFNLRVGAAYRVKTQAAWNLEEVKTAVHKGRAPGVEALVASGPALFDGDQGALYYSLSWLFVHFLRHGEPAWEQGQFPELVLYLVEGFPPAEAIEAVYGVPPAAMNAPFREYVQRF